MLIAKVSPEAKEQLVEELKQTSDAAWYRRLKIIQLSSQENMSAPQLAKLFDLCAATVREYITRYNAKGLEGLKRQASDGAPTTIPLTKADWEDLLHQSPSQFDQLQTGARNWTQEVVVDYLHRYHQVTVTQPAVSLCLKRHGMTWNRGKLKVTSPDPLYTVKRDRIDTLKKSGGRDGKQS